MHDHANDIFYLSQCFHFSIGWGKNVDPKATPFHHGHKALAMRWNFTQWSSMDTGWFGWRIISDAITCIMIFRILYRIKSEHFFQHAFINKYLESVAIVTIEFPWHVGKSSTSRLIFGALFFSNKLFKYIKVDATAILFICIGKAHIFLNRIPSGPSGIHIRIVNIDQSIRLAMSAIGIKCRACCRCSGIAIISHIDQHIGGIRRKVRISSGSSRWGCLWITFNISPRPV